MVTDEGSDVACLKGEVDEGGLEREGVEEEEQRAVALREAEGVICVFLGSSVEYLPRPRPRRSPPP